MKSTKKTYGVSGKIEWVALISCGKASVSVPFTGGTLSGYGVTPALFTTENPFYQAIIEHSSYFTSGKIRLIRESEGSGKFELKETPMPTAQIPGQPATASAILDRPLNPDGQQEADNDLQTTDGTATTADGKAIIEVTDIDDARDYLVENFGIARSSLRSNISVTRAAEEHNVVFKGLED